MIVFDSEDARYPRVSASVHPDGRFRWEWAVFVQPKHGADWETVKSGVVFRLRTAITRATEEGENRWAATLPETPPEIGTKFVWVNTTIRDPWVTWETAPDFQLDYYQAPKEDE